MEQSPSMKKKAQKDIEQTEKWSKIVAFVLTIVFPVFGILSRAMSSYYVYFATDLGAEAFQLVIPMW